MANVIADVALDAPLNVLKTGNILHVTSAQPANFAGIAAVTLGNKSAPVIGAIADYAGAGGGRKVEVAPFADGAVTATGTAAFWVLADTVDSALLSVVEIAAPQVLTSGNGLELTSPITFIINDAVAA